MNRRSLLVMFVAFIFAPSFFLPILAVGQTTLPTITVGGSTGGSTSGGSTGGGAGATTPASGGSTGGGTTGGTSGSPTTNTANTTNKDTSKSKMPDCKPSSGGKTPSAKSNEAAGANKGCVPGDGQVFDKNIAYPGKCNSGGKTVTSIYKKPGTYTQAGSKITGSCSDPGQFKAETCDGKPCTQAPADSGSSGSGTSAGGTGGGSSSTQTDPEKQQLAKEKSQALAKETAKDILSGNHTEVAQKIADFKEKGGNIEDLRAELQKNPLVNDSTSPTAQAAGKEALRQLDPGQSVLVTKPETPLPWNDQSKLSPVTQSSRTLDQYSKDLLGSSLSPDKTYQPFSSTLNPNSPNNPNSSSFSQGGQSILGGAMSQPLAFKPYFSPQSVTSFDPYSPSSVGGSPYPMSPASAGPGSLSPNTSGAPTTFTPGSPIADTSRFQPYTANTPAPVSPVAAYLNQAKSAGNSVLQTWDTIRTSVAEQFSPAPQPVATDLSASPSASPSASQSGLPRDTFSSSKLFIRDDQVINQALSGDPVGWGTLHDIQQQSIPNATGPSADTQSAHEFVTQQLSDGVGASQPQASWVNQQLDTLKAGYEDIKTNLVAARDAMFGSPSPTGLSSEGQKPSPLVDYMAYKTAPVGAGALSGYGAIPGGSTGNPFLNTQKGPFETSEFAWGKSNYSYPVGNASSEPASVAFANKGTSPFEYNPESPIVTQGADLSGIYASSAQGTPSWDQKVQGSGLAIIGSANAAEGQGGAQGGSSQSIMYGGTPQSPVFLNNEKTWDSNLKISPQGLPTIVQYQNKVGDFAPKPVDTTFGPAPQSPLIQQSGRFESIAQGAGGSQPGWGDLYTQNQYNAGQNALLEEYGANPSRAYVGPYAPEYYAPYTGSGSGQPPLQPGAPDESATRAFLDGPASTFGTTNGQIDQAAARVADAHETVQGAREGAQTMLADAQARIDALKPGLDSRAEAMRAADAAMQKYEFDHLSQLRGGTDCANGQAACFTYVPSSQQDAKNYTLLSQQQHVASALYDKYIEQQYKPAVENLQSAVEDYNDAAKGAGLDASTRYLAAAEDQSRLLHQQLDAATSPEQQRAIQQQINANNTYVLGVASLDDYQRNTFAEAKLTTPTTPQEIYNQQVLDAAIMGRGESLQNGNARAFDETGLRVEQTLGLQPKDAGYDRAIGIVQAQAQCQASGCVDLGYYPRALRDTLAGAAADVNAAWSANKNNSWSSPSYYIAGAAKVGSLLTYETGAGLISAGLDITGTESYATQLNRAVSETERDYQGRQGESLVTLMAVPGLWGAPSVVGSVARSTFRGIADSTLVANIGSSISRVNTSIGNMARSAIETVAGPVGLDTRAIMPTSNIRSAINVNGATVSFGDDLARSAGLAADTRLGAAGQFEQAFPRAGSAPSAGIESGNLLGSPVARLGSEVPTTRLGGTLGDSYAAGVPRTTTPLSLGSQNANGVRELASRPPVTTVREVSQITPTQSRAISTVNALDQKYGANIANPTPLESRISTAVTQDTQRILKDAGLQISDFGTTIRNAEGDVVARQVLSPGSAGKFAYEPVAPLPAGVAKPVVAQVTSPAAEAVIRAGTTDASIFAPEMRAVTAQGTLDTFRGLLPTISKENIARIAGATGQFINPGTALATDIRAVLTEAPTAATQVLSTAQQTALRAVPSDVAVRQAATRAVAESLPQVARSPVVDFAASRLSLSPVVAPITASVFSPSTVAAQPTQVSSLGTAPTRGLIGDAGGTLIRSDAITVDSITGKPLSAPLPPSRPADLTTGSVGTPNPIGSGVGVKAATPVDVGTGAIPGINQGSQFIPREPSVSVGARQVGWPFDSSSALGATLNKGAHAIIAVDPGLTAAGAPVVRVALIAGVDTSKPFTISADSSFNVESNQLRGTEFLIAGVNLPADYNVLQKGAAAFVPVTPPAGKTTADLVNDTVNAYLKLTDNNTNTVIAPYNPLGLNDPFKALTGRVANPNSNNFAGRVLQEVGIPASEVASYKPQIAAGSVMPGFGDVLSGRAIAAPAVAPATPAPSAVATADRGAVQEGKAAPEANTGIPDDAFIENEPTPAQLPGSEASLQPTASPAATASYTTPVASVQRPLFDKIADFVTDPSSWTGISSAEARPRTPINPDRQATSIAELYWVTQALSHMYGIPDAQIPGIAEAIAGAYSQEASLNPDVWNRPTSVFAGPSQTSKERVAENVAFLRFAAQSPYLNLSAQDRKIFTDLANRLDALSVAGLDTRKDLYTGIAQLAVQMFTLDPQGAAENLPGTGAGFSTALVAAKVALNPDGTINPKIAAAVMQTGQICPDCILAYSKDPNATLTPTWAGYLNSKYNLVDVKAGDLVSKSFEKMLTSKKNYATNFTRGINQMNQYLYGGQPVAASETPNPIGPISFMTTVEGVLRDASDAARKIVAGNVSPRPTQTTQSTAPSRGLQDAFADAQRGGAQVEEAFKNTILHPWDTLSNIGSFLTSPFRSTAQQGAVPVGCAGGTCVRLDVPCKNESSCYVSPRIAEKVKNLHLAVEDIGARVTEAVPNTRAHKSPTQANGTSVDYGKAGGMTPDEIIRVIAAAEANGLRPVYEVQTTRQKNSLVQAGVPKGSIIVVGGWITAPHFSIYDRAGAGTQVATAPTVPTPPSRPSQQTIDGLADVAPAPILVDADTVFPKILIMEPDAVPVQTANVPTPPVRPGDLGSVVAPKQTVQPLAFSNLQLGAFNGARGQFLAQLESPDVLPEPIPVDIGSFIPSTPIMEPEVVQPIYANVPTPPSRPSQQTIDGLADVAPDAEPIAVPALQLPKPLILQPEEIAVQTANVPLPPSSAGVEALRAAAQDVAPAAEPIEVPAFTTPAPLIIQPDVPQPVYANVPTPPTRPTADLQALAEAEARAAADALAQAQKAANEKIAADQARIAAAARAQIAAEDTNLTRAQAQEKAAQAAREKIAAEDVLAQTQKTINENLAKWQEQVAQKQRALINAEDVQEARDAAVARDKEASAAYDRLAAQAQVERQRLADIQAQADKAAADAQLAEQTKAAAQKLADAERAQKAAADAQAAAKAKRDAASAEYDRLAAEFQARARAAEAARLAAQVTAPQSTQLPNRFASPLYPYSLTGFANVTPADFQAVHGVSSNEPQAPTFPASSIDRVSPQDALAAARAEAARLAFVRPTANVPTPPSRPGNIGSIAAPKAVLDINRILRPVSTGEDVANWQEFLISRGYGKDSSGKDMPLDGIYGPRTEQATREFQKAVGVRVDGIFGPETRAVLREESTAPTTPAPTAPTVLTPAEQAAPVPSPLLSRDLQNLMNKPLRDLTDAKIDSLLMDSKETVFAIVRDVCAAHGRACQLPNVTIDNSAGRPQFLQKAQTIFFGRDGIRRLGENAPTQAAAVGFDALLGLAHETGHKLFHDTGNQSADSTQSTEGLIDAEAQANFFAGFVAGRLGIADRGDLQRFVDTQGYKTGGLGQRVEDAVFAGASATDFDAGFKAFFGVGPDWSLIPQGTTLAPQTPQTTVIAPQDDIFNRAAKWLGNLLNPIFGPSAPQAAEMKQAPLPPSRPADIGTPISGQEAEYFNNVYDSLCTVMTCTDAVQSLRSNAGVAAYRAASQQAQADFEKAIFDIDHSDVRNAAFQKLNNLMNDIDAVAKSSQATVDQKASADGAYEKYLSIQNEFFVNGALYTNPTVGPWLYLTQQIEAQKVLTPEQEQLARQYNFSQDYIDTHQQVLKVMLPSDTLPAFPRSLPTNTDPVRSKLLKDLTPQELDRLLQEDSGKMQDYIESVFVARGVPYHRVNLISFNGKLEDLLKRGGVFASHDVGIYYDLPNRTVYVDTAMAQQRWNSKVYSNATAATFDDIIAHELAHYVAWLLYVDQMAQTLAGSSNYLPYSDPNGYRVNVLLELQADTLGGVIMGGSGVLRAGDPQEIYFDNVGEGDDLVRRDGELISLQDSVFNPAATHPRGIERGQAVYEGMSTVDFDAAIGMLGIQPRWNNAAIFENPQRVLLARNTQDSILNKITLESKATILLDVAMRLGQYAWRSVQTGVQDSRTVALPTLPNKMSPSGTIILTNGAVLVPDLRNKSAWNDIADLPPANLVLIDGEAEPIHKAILGVKTTAAEAQRQYQEGEFAEMVRGTISGLFEVIGASYMMEQYALHNYTPTGALFSKNVVDLRKAIQTSAREVSLAASNAKGRLTSDLNYALERGKIVSRYADEVSALMDKMEKDRREGIRLTPSVPASVTEGISPTIPQTPGIPGQPIQEGIPTPSGFTIEQPGASVPQTVPAVKPNRTFLEKVKDYFSNTPVLDILFSASKPQAAEGPAVSAPVTAVTPSTLDNALARVQSSVPASTEAVSLSQPRTFWEKVLDPTGWSFVQSAYGRAPTISSCTAGGSNCMVPTRIQASDSYGGFTYYDPRRMGINVSGDGQHTSNQQWTDINGDSFASRVYPLNTVAYVKMENGNARWLYQADSCGGCGIDIMVGAAQRLGMKGTMPGTIVPAVNFADLSIDPATGQPTQSFDRSAAAARYVTQVLNSGSTLEQAMAYAKQQGVLQGLNQPLTITYGPDLINSTNAIRTGQPIAQNGVPGPMAAAQARANANMANAQINANNNMANTFFQGGGDWTQRLPRPGVQPAPAVVSPTPVAAPDPALVQKKTDLQNSLTALKTSVQAAEAAQARAVALGETAEALNPTLQGLQAGKSVMQAAGEIANKAGDQQLASAAAELSGKIDQMIPVIQGGIANPLSLMGSSDQLSKALNGIFASGKDIASRAETAVGTEIASIDQKITEAQKVAQATPQWTAPVKMPESTWKEEVPTGTTETQGQPSFFGQPQPTAQKSRILIWPGVRGINPVVYAAMQEAVKHLPAGYTIRIVSGARDSSTVGAGSFHVQRDSQGNGLAVDISIVTPDGQSLRNIRAPENFHLYREFMQNVKAAQDRLYPQYKDLGRWGGYFSTKADDWKGDIMHYDLGPSSQTAAGNWQQGLSSQFAFFSNDPNEVGKGMSAPYQIASAPGAPTTPDTQVASNPRGPVDWVTIGGNPAQAAPKVPEGVLALAPGEKVPTTAQPGITAAAYHPTTGRAYVCSLSMDKCKIALPQAMAADLVALGYAPSVTLHSVAQGSPEFPGTVSTPAAAPTQTNTQTTTEVPMLSVPEAPTHLYNKPGGQMSDAEIKQVVDYGARVGNNYYSQDYAKRGKTYASTNVNLIMSEQKVSQVIGTDMSQPEQSGAYYNAKTNTVWISAAEFKKFASKYDLTGEDLISLALHEIGHHVGSDLGLQPGMNPGGQDPTNAEAQANFFAAKAGVATGLFNQRILQNLIKTQVGVYGPVMVDAIKAGAAATDIDTSVQAFFKMTPNWNKLPDLKIAQAVRVESLSSNTTQPKTVVPTVTLASITGGATVRPQAAADTSGAVAQAIPVAQVSMTAQKPSQISASNLFDQITNKLMDFGFGLALLMQWSTRNRRSGTLPQPAVQEQTAGDGVPPPTPEEQTRRLAQIDADIADLAAQQQSAELAVVEANGGAEAFEALDPAERVRLIQSDSQFGALTRRINALSEEANAIEAGQTLAAESKALVTGATDVPQGGFNTVLRRETPLDVISQPGGLKVALRQTIFENPKTTIAVVTGGSLGSMWAVSSLVGGIGGGTQSTPADAAAGGAGAAIAGTKPGADSTLGETNPDGTPLALFVADPAQRAAPGVTPPGTVPVPRPQWNPTPGGNPSYPGMPSYTGYPDQSGYGSPMSPWQQQQMQQQRAMQQQQARQQQMQQQAQQQQALQNLLRQQQQQQAQQAAQQKNTTPPTIQFSASPSTVTLFASTTLQWTSTNTTSCYIFDPAGKLVTQGAQSGSYPIAAVTETTSYGLTCTSYSYGQNTYATTTVMIATSTQSSGL